MAAKLLHRMADENSDLQKKIGCMNGIFQIFDRQHVLTSRRKSLTLGNAHVNSIYCESDSAFQLKDSKTTEKTEKVTRVSTESSRVSFSSSCSSSSPLSSEINREAQPEVSAYDRVIFPESPTNDPVMSQGSGFSPHMGLDLRDVVRDSMYREGRGLSEVCRHRRREDSPRPFGLKHSTPVDFDESCKALAKIRKASKHYYNNEADTKDVSRYFVDSRDKFKSKKKVKELPRLSLDNKDHIDLKSGSIFSESFSRSSGSPKRPPSIVAKLMGLDTLSGSPLGRDRINMFEDNSDPFSRSLRESSLNRALRFSPSSPRSLGNDPASSSPRWRSSEFVMKPLSSLRFPIEQAPWKQTDRNRFSQKQASRPVNTLSRSMEGKLKDIDFTHSGKDLRAFKEILEAIEPNVAFDTRKQPQCSNLEPQRDYKTADSATSSQGSRGQQNRVVPQAAKGPIVIMKPARLVEQSGIPSSSLIPIHSLSSLSTTCREESDNVKRGSTSREKAKERSSGKQRDGSSISSVDHKSSSRNVRSSLVSKESSSKNPGSASPRLHQKKKHENDKHSRPPTNPCDSRKLRMQTNRQSEEVTASPGGERRPRAQRSLQQNDDQLRQTSNKFRTKTESSRTIKQTTEACGGKSPSVIEAAKTVVSNLMKNKTSPKCSEDGSSEHPSPVSVLNASIYKEIKSSGNGLTDSGDEHYKEDQWNPAYSFSETTTSFSPEINRRKLQNVEHLVQKLKRLNSSHDEASQDYIASLCDNNDPNTDHRYISEILLASGLLLRDLGSELTLFQLHPSGHPINPELFLVLEQTKGSLNNNNNNNEKFNRKLVFDAVNELLVKKLAFVEGTSDPWMKQAKTTKRVSTAQQLLKELCSEIETMQKQAKKRSNNLLLLEEEEEEDFLKCILDEDMAIRSGKWTGFDDVIPSLVLDLERLLFKDLVSEIVHSEIGLLQGRNSGR
ncbi:unnamed protein product [Cochlearia groenlandica]